MQIKRQGRVVRTATSSASILQVKETYYTSKGDLLHK
jgi:hypothetical protein